MKQPHVLQLKEDFGGGADGSERSHCGRVDALLGSSSIHNSYYRAFSQESRDDVGKK